MKKMTFTGKLVNYERRNSSYYRNPKYCGYFENEKDSFCGTTATDASCAYGFLNDMDKERIVTYHITKTGNAIIDYIKIMKE